MTFFFAVESAEIPGLLLAGEQYQQRLSLAQYYVALTDNYQVSSIIATKVSCSQSKLLVVNVIS